PRGESIASFAAGKSAGIVRFLCVTAGQSDVYPRVQGNEQRGYRGVYEMTWPAVSWTRKTDGIATGHRPFWVVMARNNANVAYLGGGSQEGAPTIYKTTDGGSHWQSVLHTRNNANIATGWSGDKGDRAWTYGEFVLGLEVHPGDLDRVAFTDLGF